MVRVRSGFYQQARSTANVALLTVALIVAGACQSVQKSCAAEIDGTVVLVRKTDIIGNLGGTMANFAYDSANDTYYVGLFGATAGLRKISRNSPGDPWQTDVYVDDITGSTPSDLLRFLKSSDGPNGVVDANDAGGGTMGGMLLNPKTLVVTVPTTDALGVPNGGTQTITYAPGTLAFISQATSSVSDVKDSSNASQVRFDWTKRVYRWDLREIGAPTAALPDYSTGTSGAAGDPNPGGAFGALGQADWNDVLTMVASKQDLRSAYTAKTGLTPIATETDNFARQMTWSSDGQSLYAVDSGTNTGGIYKISATTNAVTMLYHEPGTNLGGEPSVVHTSVRNFGGGFGAGDQIIFDGSPANANDGGLSYVVHNGTTTSATKVLVSGAQFSSFAELAGTGSVSSTATDSQGNVYFFDSSSAGLFKYDTQGRFSAVLNKAQAFEVSQVEASSDASFTGSNTRTNAGGMLRLQVYEDASGTYLTYRGNNRYVAAVKIYETGDFDKNGVLDQADKVFFQTQFNKTYHGGAPNPLVNGAAIDDYVDYIAADLNGSINPNGTTANAGFATTRPTVTFKDLQILSQFITLAHGDLNWDGMKDATDLAILMSHKDVAASAFGWTSYSWFDGDLTGVTYGVPDGIVNELDLAYFNAAVPEPSSIAMLAIGVVLVGGIAYRRRKRQAVQLVI